MSLQVGAFKASWKLTAAAAGGGGFLAIPNPEGSKIIITRVVVDRLVASSGVCTVDIGIAANGTTANDTLIDGLDVAALGLADNIKDKGSNGLERKIWGATEFLTISKVSGAINSEIGSQGNIYIHYIRA